MTSPADLLRLLIRQGPPYIPCVHSPTHLCCTALDIHRRLVYTSGVLRIHQPTLHSKYYSSAHPLRTAAQCPSPCRTRAHHCTTFTSHSTGSSWGSYSGLSGRTTSTSRRACYSRLRAHSSSLTAHAPLSPALYTHIPRTNQTTLENVSPFLLLRHLPPLPRPPPGPGAQPLSDPPLAHQLSHAQRRLVHDAHFNVRFYDVGWRRNWAQVMGWDRPWGWVYRLLVGGGW